MGTTQERYIKIVESLNIGASLLLDEGLESYGEKTQSLIRQIEGDGNIVCSHKGKLYSILRMMLESNAYYGSKAAKHLDQAFVLIKEALEEGA